MYIVFIYEQCFAPNVDLYHDLHFLNGNRVLQYDIANAQCVHYSLILFMYLYHHV